MTSGALYRRGWTEGAIRRFLPVPDGTVPNLRYRASPPIRLYSCERVAAVEKGGPWRTWRDGLLRRRPGGRARAAPFRSTTVEVAPTVDVGAATDAGDGHEHKGERP